MTTPTRRRILMPRRVWRRLPATVTHVVAAASLAASLAIPAPAAPPKSAPAPAAAPGDASATAPAAAPSPPPRPAAPGAPAAEPVRSPQAPGQTNDTTAVAPGPGRSPADTGPVVTRTPHPPAPRPPITKWPSPHLERAASAYAVRTAPVPPPRPGLRKSVLIGIFSLTTGRTALMRFPSGDVRRLAVGDTVDGWRVSSIGSDALRLTRGNENRTFVLTGN